MEESRKRKLHAIEDAGNVFEKIRENANSLLEAKKKRTESPYPVVTDGALLFQKLREDHRDVCEEVEDTKSKAQKAKPKLDQLNLQLQNLLYERNYYLKEIQRCREFKPKNEVLDLVDVERFLEKAPQEWNNTEPTPDAPPALHHKFMLHRLQFELQERKRLGKELDELRAERTRSQIQQQTKQELLNNIQHNLASVYQAALPLQQYFGTSTLRRSTLMNEAQHLSVPLYTLFSRLHAFKESSGDDFEVAILGDISQAIQGCKQEVEDTMPLTTTTNTKAKQSPAVPKKMTIQSQSEEVYKSHPLEVLLRFTGSEDGVRFSFLPTLRLVAVTGEGGLSGALTNLFPDDTGIPSPNPTNRYLFSGEEFAFSKTHPSRPYRWAQDICGLQFLPSEPTSVAPLLLADVITQLKSRLKTRRSLRTQLDLLAKNSIAVSSSQRTTTQLVSWAEIKPSMYHEFVTQDRLSKCTEDIPCRYYCAMFRRVDAVLDVRIALRSDYPVYPPELRLKMVTGIDEAKGEQIKALETQINTEKADQSENMILSILLHKVQTAFDDIMEKK